MKLPKFPRFIKNFFSLTGLCLLLYVMAFCILSCSNYGFFWGRFDQNEVDERSGTVQDFNRYAPDLSVASSNPNWESGHEIFTAEGKRRYSVLVITDLHYGSSREDINEAAFLTWLESIYKAGGENVPRFAINLGDSADGGHESEYDNYILFEKKIKALAGKYLWNEDENTADDKRKFRIFSILGNHDLYNNGSKYFLKKLFPYSSSYHFTIDTDISDDYSGFSYYFLDTANGTTGPTQLEDFKTKIYADPHPKVILTHYPIWAGGTDSAFAFMIIQNSMERNLLLTYFIENNVKYVLEGHAHKNYGVDYGGQFKEEVIGSLRFSSRDAKQCAIFTVDEEKSTVTTQVYKF